jgi:endoglucanase
MRFLLVLTLLSALGFAPGSRGAADSAAGYWHTSGTRILAGDGHPVRIVGINWYGMESATWVPAGLNFQPYGTIIDEIKLLGFNTIRLPLSDELVMRNPIVTLGVAANPEMRGKRALDVLDMLVRYAGKAGLKIVLDNQRSHAARPYQVNNLDEPLWYTRQFPQSAWLRDWETLARRYAGNSAVVGVDLRNEPHTAGPGPWNLHAYLHQGATWGPYRGVSDPARDWRAAAQRAGNAILSINPHLLVVVEGVQLYPDASAPGRVDSSWWGGILSPVTRYPVTLAVPHQLVYSVHDWGPSKWQMPWFGGMRTATLQSAWTKLWGFLPSHPGAAYAAPLWIGEFGTCSNKPECIRPHMPQGWWFNALVHYLRAHEDVSWSFFALDGTNSNDCATHNGLLNPAWNNVASWTVQKALVLAGAAPSGGAILQRRGPLIPGTVTARKPRDPNSALCKLP